VAKGTLADLGVNISANQAPFERGLSSVRGKLVAASGEFRRLATIPMVIGGAGGGMFLKSAIMAASELEETVSKIGVVFGAQAGMVGRFADDMANKFGTVKQEAMEGVAAFGQLLMATGQSQAEAAKNAMQLVKLADNLASQDQMSFAEAVQKLSSGLAGETEPLRKHGVLMNDAAVKAKAAALGLEEYSEEAKVISRMAIIFEGLNRVMDDHANTLKSTANQAKRLAGEWQNLKAQIGGGLTGPAAATLGFTNDIVRVLAKATPGKLLGQYTARPFSAEKDAASRSLEAQFMTTDGKSLVGEQGAKFQFGADTAQGQAERRAYLKSLGINNPSTKAIGGASVSTQGDAELRDKQLAARKFDLYGFGAESQFTEEMALLRGASMDATKKDIAGKLKGEERQLADMEKSRRDRLAQGGVMGDQFSAVSSLQNEILNDLPRQQLEQQKESVASLKRIEELLKNDAPGSLEKAGAILAGPA
jgi:hypothetical protein